MYYKQEIFNPSKRSEEKTLEKRNGIDSYNSKVKNLVKKFEPLTSKEHLTRENPTTPKVTRIVGKYELLRKSSHDKDHSSRKDARVARRCTPSKTPGKLRKYATLQTPSKTPRKMNTLEKLFSRKTEIERVELLESTSPLYLVSKTIPLKLKSKTDGTKQTNKHENT